MLGGCCITPALACDSPDLTCTTCNWTGFELNGQLFEENDLAGVMNATPSKAQSYSCRAPASASSSVTPPEMNPRPGWTEMLSTMTDAFGELVEHAATVRQAADTTDAFISEFDHPLAEHAELRYQAERCLKSMRQQLVGLALAVIAAHAEAGDSTAVEMADRAASGVVRRYQEDAAAAVETIHAKTPAAVRMELAGKVCGLVMMHGSVMTLTNNDDVHVHFGWRSNPLGEWGPALWQDGQEPIRTWTDPLSATEVVDEIMQRLDLNTETTLTGVNVQSLESLFERW